MKQTMNIKSRLAVWLAATVFCAAPYQAIVAAPAASETSASAWFQGFNNKARLIAGQASGGPHGASPMTYAGLEIEMPAGWKTYWRNPGEAGGIPPEFDLEGSENLESATVLYPVPQRLTDKAGSNIGYKDRVIFPIGIMAKDKTKGVKLKVKAAYGVCKEICVPAEAELGIDVLAGAAPSQELADVLQAVPVRSADPMPAKQADKEPASTIDPAKDPSLKLWRLDGAKLVLEVKDPGGEKGDAFLYSPDGLYMPMTKKVSEGNGQTVFEADLADGNKLEELKGKFISVTLSGAKGQSETFIQLP